MRHRFFIEFAYISKFWYHCMTGETAGANSPGVTRNFNFPPVLTEELGQHHVLHWYLLGAFFDF